MREVETETREKRVTDRLNLRAGAAFLTLGFFDEVAVPFFFGLAALSGFGVLLPGGWTAKDGVLDGPATEGLAEGPAANWNGEDGASELAMASAALAEAFLFPSLLFIFSEILILLMSAPSMKSSWLEADSLLMVVLGFVDAALGLEALTSSIVLISKGLAYFLACFVLF